MRLICLILILQLNCILSQTGNNVIQNNSFRVPASANDHNEIIRHDADEDYLYSWVMKFSASGKVFKDVYFPDLMTGYIVTELGAVYKTTNGGNNWISVMNLGFPYYWYGVYALSPDTVVIAGFNNQDSITRGVVKWSYNGGTTWQNDLRLRKQGNGVGWLDRIHFFNSNTGFVMNGFSGGCFVTTTGGKDSASWTYVLINSDMAWFNGSIDAMPNGRVYATGIHFAYSVNYGLNWVSGPSADNVFDGGVDFLDGNINYGWTGGGQISAPVSGWVHRTTDGGVTWSSRLNTFAYPIRTLKFFNQNTGFVAGGNLYQDVGGIWLTTDAGNNWALDVNTGAEMFSFDTKVTGQDSTVIWCVGSTGGSSGYTGKAYKTVIPVITGITYNNDMIPDKFLLYQNYPNPFNPVTKIKFGLPLTTDVSSSGNSGMGLNRIVQLCIFNSLGQLVTVLLDEPYKSGEYALSWDASKYSSGVYYYGLLVDGNVLDSKKMLLIK